MVLGTDLTEKMAVVTSAGGIPCGMFTRMLARVGVAVASLGINLEAAEETARNIREAGGTAAAYGVDVVDKKMLESVHARVLVQLGSCDTPIDGAGGNQARANMSKEYLEIGDIKADMTTFSNMERKGVQSVLDLNFLGGFLTCQVSTKDIVGREGCSIINISSASAVRSLTRISAYSGAAAALSNSIQWLTVHFARAGTRVNTIAPGLSVTRQNEGLLYDEDGKPVAKTAKVLAAIPTRRFGKPEELSGALTPLFNNEVAGFIAGVILPVDGGSPIYSGV